MQCSKAEDDRPVRTLQISHWKRVAMRSNESSPLCLRFARPAWVMTMPRLELIDPRSCIIASYEECEGGAVDK